MVTATMLHRLCWNTIVSENRSNKLKTLTWLRCFGTQATSAGRKKGKKRYSVKEINEIFSVLEAGQGNFSNVTLPVRKKGSKLKAEDVEFSSKQKKLPLKDAELQDLDLAVKRGSLDKARTQTNELRSKVNNGSKGNRIPFGKSRISEPKSKDMNDPYLRKRRYSMTAKMTPPYLAVTLENYNTFMTKPFYRAIDPPVSKTTASSYMSTARIFIGWFIRFKIEALALQDKVDKSELVQDTAEEKVKEMSQYFGVSTDKLLVLQLEDIIPDSSSSSGKIFFEFVSFLREKRRISPSYEQQTLRALLKLIKFRFHEEVADRGTDMFPIGRGTAYDSLPIMYEVKKMLQEAAKRGKRNFGLKENEHKKWLDWPDYLAVVHHLYQEQLPESRFKCGKKKNARALARAQQRYLICAMFACIPDRQRTLRELEVGKTIRKMDLDAGNLLESYSDSVSQYSWVIKHGAEDYKTGKYYGDRPPLVLDPFLYPTLETFITESRKNLNPVEGNNKLFVNNVGHPMTRQQLYFIVAKATYDATGRRMNPHLIRDSIVTHLRNSNASEKEHEALALYMGHSLEMQKSSYDRRTHEQKVAPAIKLIKSIIDSSWTR